jgi:cell division transport system permease protein
MSRATAHRGATHAVRPLSGRSLGADAALFLVIAILAALAAIAALAARTAFEASDDWQRSLSSAMTVRLVAPDDEAAQAKVAELIGRDDAVAKSRQITRAEAEALLRPYLGEGTVPPEIRLPRLIAIDLKAEATAEGLKARLESALSGAGYEVEVDDHARWVRPVERAATTIRIVAMAIITALALAGAIAVALATTAVLATRRDLIETLHWLGIPAGRVAGVFTLRYFWIGLCAGLIGAGLTAGAALGVDAASTTDAALAVTDQFGGFALAPSTPRGWLVLLPIPWAAAVITWLSSRGAVNAALNKLG